MSNEPRYPAEVFYSEDDEGYIAIAPDLPGCSAFGESADAALRELQDAMKAWIGAAQKAGNPIPAPSRKNVDDLPSGKVLARLPKTLHAMLIERANRDSTSLNTCLVMLLSQSLADKAPEPTRASKPVVAKIHRDFEDLASLATHMLVGTTFHSTWVEMFDDVDPLGTHVDTISRGGSRLNLRSLPANRPVIVLDDENG